MLSSMPLQLPLDQVLPVLLSMFTHRACLARMVLPSGPFQAHFSFQPISAHFSPCVQHTIAVDLLCLLLGACSCCCDLALAPCTACNRRHTVSHTSWFGANCEQVWWHSEFGGDQGHHQSVQCIMSTLLEPTEQSLSKYLQDQWTFHNSSLEGVMKYHKLPKLSAICHQDVVVCRLTWADCIIGFTTVGPCTTVLVLESPC